MKQKANLPSELLLTKIFSDNKQICKVRKKKAKALREVCDTDLVDQQRAAIEEIQPRVKVTSSLKDTFTTQSQRLNLTKALNATKGSHGYIISPMEPREVSEWLSGYKFRARENILFVLNAKGYNVNDSDI